MLTALRAQVQTVLAGIPASRRPALRRSDAPDALFATDLPLVAAPDAAAGFAARMTALGWRVWEKDGWLLLDAPVPMPEASDQFADAAPGEVGCCIALLTRHPGAGEATALIRAIAKAAEAGRQPFERLCADMHRDLAARLRLHQPLPGDALPYLRTAAHRLYHSHTR